MYKYIKNSLLCKNGSIQFKIVSQISRKLSNLNMKDTIRSMMYKKYTCQIGKTTCNFGWKIKISKIQFEIIKGMNMLIYVQL